MIKFSNGDARQLLNLLETTVLLYKKVNLANLETALQSKFLRYDRAGEEHFNTISALIKSMRASDPRRRLILLGPHGE